MLKRRTYLRHREERKMATVLGKIPVNVFIHTGVLLPLTTIIVCYTIAVSLGHVPVWLPMISDCAVEAPEKYPFRWGIVLSGAFFAAQSVLVYGADRPYSRSKLALFLGLLTSFALSVVGVVNEVEDNTVHSAAAVVFFIGYEINMIVLTWLLPQYEKENRPMNLAYFFRQLCLVLTTVDLIVFIYFSTNRGKYQVYIAVCEWSATLLIFMFNWSFAGDFMNVTVDEVEESSRLKEKKLPLLLS